MRAHFSSQERFTHPAVLWTFLALALVAGIGWFGALWLREPPPAVPVPPDLEKLDPQLRDYVAAHVKWAQEKPRRTERHATLGLVYAINGLWTEARIAFENASKLDPKNPLPLLYQGVAAQELDLPAEATRLFRAVTSQFPEFAPGYYRLGTTLLRAGNFDEAEAAFERLITLAPDQWHSYAGLGEVKLRQREFDEAASLLERAVQIDFNARSAHHLLGEAYRALGRTDDAEVELLLGRNAVTFPMPDAWSEQASVHAQLLQDQIQVASELSAQGEARRAVQILSRALAYHPDNLSLMNQLAIAQNRANQPERARTLLLRALQKDPQHVPSLVTLAFCEEKLGEAAQALATADRAIALAPTLAQPYIAKANALLALERDEEAIAAFSQAAKVDPKNAEVRMEMGDVLWRNLNRPAEAREQYETARKLDPGLAPVYVRLADMFLQERQLPAAREALAKLGRLAPGIPDLQILERRLKKLEAE